jgi:hypothetical protein
VPASGAILAQPAAHRGHERIIIRLYIYIYIYSFCEAQSGPVRGNNERQITIVGAPQKHRYFCNSKGPSIQLWGAQRSLRFRSI